MSKYKKAYQEMFASHEKEFGEFKKIHDLYRSDPKKWEDEFNYQGKVILEIIRRGERILCGKMEGSGRGIYSGGLADKFWQEVRNDFPSIDMIGVKVS